MIINDFIQEFKFLPFNYFSDSIVSSGDHVRSTPIRGGTEFAEAISILRTFIHPLYTRNPVTYYYDIAVMELGKCYNYLGEYFS